MPMPTADSGAAPEPEPGAEPEPDPTPDPSAGDDGMPPDDPPPDDPGKLPPPEDPPGGSDDGETGDMEPTIEECPPSYDALLWADDAMVSGPIEMLPAVDADGEPLIAVSFDAEQGEVEFTLDLPCAGDFYVHGLVWDAAPGAYASGDPDSFYVSTGSPTEFTWRYGCQTGGSSMALTWQPLQRLDAQPCDVTPITLSAPAAGQYTLTIRNREAGGNVPSVAGIGAIAISMDETLDPATLYDPFP